MEVSERMADRLRPGKYSTPRQLISNIKEMAPEQILRRLGGAKDVELQQHLDINFPVASRAIKESHIDALLKKAALAPRAIENGIDTRVLFKQIDSMSPELKASVFSEGQLAKIESIQKLVQRLPERTNPSGTAKALDSILNSSGGGLALIGSLLSGGSVFGALAGFMAKAVGRDAPDAIKLSLLKVLGTEGPIDSVALKGMVTLAEQAYKAASTTKKAVKSIFRPSSALVVQPLSLAQVKAIDKSMMQAQQDPQGFMERTTGMSSYVPEHATSYGMFTANAVKYLTSLRPKTGEQAPLDKPSIDPVAEARFHRAVQIASNPILALEAVRDGSLTAQDVITLGTVYPKLYATYRQQLMAEIVDVKTKGEEIPFKMVVPLSMFLQMPLESSVMPYNMSINQQAYLPPANDRGPVKGNLDGIKGIAEAASTPNQARQMERK
jgi:hypothetical protein